MTKPDYPAEYRTSSCDGKEPYATVGLAMKVLKRRRRKGGDHSALAAYRCNHCGLYHIGKGLRTSHKRGMPRPQKDIR